MNTPKGTGRALAGKAAKAALKGAADWPHFCWNCGNRISIGQMRCSRCGAITSGKTKYLSPCTPMQSTRSAGRLHPSVLRYKAKAVFGTLLFMILFSAGLSVFMFVSGDLDLDDEGIHIMSMILTVLWIFWFIWLIAEYGGTGRRMKEARSANRTPGRTSVICGVCRGQNDLGDNYCTHCGCILMK